MAMGMHGPVHPVSESTIRHIHADPPLEPLVAACATAKPPESHPERTEAPSSIGGSAVPPGAVGNALVAARHPVIVDLPHGRFDIMQSAR